MTRWVVVLVALASCRQVFGIDDPVPPEDAHANVMAGLLMHGLRQQVLWVGGDDVSTAWGKITDTFEFQATKGVWLGDAPQLASVNITDVTMGFSVWFEGEVLIDDHAITFALTADDYAFVDFARDGSHFSRLTDSTAGHNSFQQLTNLNANTWYPIRAGWSSFGGADETFALSRFTTTFAPLGADHLRYIAP